MRRGEHRVEEDLHAICTRSVSLLHTRELRCVTRAKARRGIGGLAGPRRAGAIRLRSKSVGTLSVALAGVREWLRLGRGQ
jgi:hypothetical protein